jgi:hypothetical protein
MNELLPPQTDTALWIVQGLLVFVFLAAGLLKTTQPIAKLTKFGPWVASYPAVIVRLIGVTEILCADLLLVGLFHFTTLLTPVCPATWRSSAPPSDSRCSQPRGAHHGWRYCHTSPRKEYGSVVVTALLLLLALVTIVARLTLPLA